MNTQNSKNTNKQAIIWGRYSSEKQSEGDSRERQERLNRAYAKREGVKVIAEYFDEATSVKTGPTPRFKEIISTLPKDVGIIAEDLDRISRGKSWHQMAYIEKLNNDGHWIATSKDGQMYDTTTMAELSTQIVGTIKTLVGNAENEKRIGRVREEVAKAIQLAREGKPAPLGAWLPAHLKYNFETKQYDINKENKAVMNRIFEEYLSGKGTRTICMGLNADNTCTFGSKKEGRWTASAICKMLRNERAIGTLTINEERILKAFPPAIDETLFFQVQDMLAKNINRRGNRSADKVQNVFRGLCRCSVCGGGLKVYGNKYLGCYGYRTGRKDKNGNRCSVKKMVLFAEMEREFLSWFVPHAKDALIGKDDSYPRIDALQAKRKALQDKIEKALDWLADDTSPMPEQQIKSRLTMLEVEKRQVEANLSEAKAEASTKAVMPETFQQLETLTREANLGNQEIRRKIANVVTSLVKSIVINITDKLFPSFHVVLIDDKEIDYTMTMASVYGVDAYKTA